MVWSLIAEIIIALLSTGSNIFARFQSVEQIFTYSIISYSVIQNVHLFFKAIINVKIHRVLTENRADRGKCDIH